MVLANMLQYLNDVWNNYIRYIVFLIPLIYSLFGWMNRFLPVRFRLNKRFKFYIRIKKVISEIQISIFCNKEINPDKLFDLFKNHFNENFNLLREIKGNIALKSVLTGVHYTVQLSESDDESKSIVTIETSNAFGIGKRGNLKKSERMC